MLDLRGGRVAYCVLSFGGVFGLGSKLFAVPWRALTLDTEHHCFILNASKDKLKNAPGFDKNNWPDMADPGWISAISGFYGTEPYTTE